MPTRIDVALRRTNVRASRPRPGPPPPIVIGFIGDSITGGALASSIGVNDAVTVCKNALAAGGRVVTSVNQGVSGTVAHDWIPSFGTHYSTAVAAFASAGVTLVHVMLGTNDCRHPPAGVAWYLENLAICVNALVSAGYKVIISYSPYVDYTNPTASGQGWESDSTAELVAFQGAINGLVNGTTIFQGDVTSFAHFQSNTAQMSDGIHPNDAGHAFLGAAWAFAITATNL